MPNLVGAEGERYGNGSPDQLERAPARLMELVDALEPDRIFVFSKKAWRLWPDYTGGLKDGTLQVPDVGEFDCGTYHHANGESVAFGFPHPQYSSTEAMKAAVSAALAFDPKQATTDSLK